MARNLQAVFKFPELSIRHARAETKRVVAVRHEA
jgi:hypothetical protein